MDSRPGVGLYIRNQQEAYSMELAKLRKKLEEQGMVFSFDADMPLSMTVKLDDEQTSMEDESEFSFILSMDVWGRITYKFKGCDWTTVPEAVLTAAKAGFKKIAGAGLLLEHYYHMQERRTEADG